ncbi:MAG TPA: tripartite tricarboxylate transporter permease [Vicinamibacteria bacterium]|nr:tripartite tricarboxylate transporter permease [Vicinamibacteria bacterium]
MDALGPALSQVLDPTLLAVIVGAALYGTLFGSIPGLSATMAVALIVPLTYFLSPLAALAAVVTLEACAISAGDIPSALVRIPGTPASAAYADDLYQLAQRGQYHRALGVSITFSAIGGLFGVAVLVLFARPFASIATWFTVAEYFWLYVLGLGCAVVVSRGSALKGAFALLLGLLFSTVGLSPVHTAARFTFGRPELYQGISFIPAMVGLFGLSEVLRNVRSPWIDAATAVRPDVVSARQSIGAVFGGALGLLVRRPWASLQASAIGTLIGILPGAGADIAAWVSYGVSKRGSKTPDEYGRGSMEGLADAGAANNSALAGAWVPALTLGIPGDSITAIVLGIMMMKNLQPGPEIFDKQGALVHSLFLVFFLANLVLLPTGYLAIRASGLLMRVPRHTLLPVVVLFCVMGSYAIGGSYFDVGLMAAMGLLGFVLERGGVPVGPVVLGIILGGPLEERFVQAMTASGGSPWVFFARPSAAVLGVAAASVWLLPAMGAWRAHRRSRRGDVV